MKILNDIIYVQLELNFNFISFKLSYLIEFQFNYIKISLKKIEMQVGGKVD